jgi:hypothetical protein
VDDLDEVWRDDQLIERLARGEAPDDPALAPLLALSRVADAAPAPAPDLDPAALVDDGKHRRYAVRSLAVAVTAVVTLSTSGVAAVVTGDPFRPAKAVWQEIQEQTGSGVVQVESGEAMGAALPADSSADADTGGDADTLGDVMSRQPWELRPAPASTPAASLAADQDTATPPEPGTAQPSTAEGGPTASTSPSPTEEGTETEPGSEDSQQPDDGATTGPQDEQDDGQQPSPDGSDDEPDGQTPEDPEESPTPDDDEIEPPLLNTPAPQRMRSPESTLEQSLQPTTGLTTDPAPEPTTAIDDGTASETEPAEEDETPTGASTLEEPLDDTVTSLNTAP